MQPSTRLHQLTGLRYFAALLVFFNHSSISDTEGILQAALKQGFVGVSFFFILSGFVISHSYSRKLTTGALSVGTYLALRYARILPLHIMTSLPFLAIVFWKGNFEPLLYILNTALLQSWIPSSAYYFSFNGPSWSLSDEMFFYFCFIPLVFLGKDAQNKIFAVLLSIILLSATLVQLNLPNAILWGNHTLSHWLFYIFPGFRLLEFLTGMILYNYWSEGRLFNTRISSLSIPLLFVSMCAGQFIPEPFRMSLYYLPFAAFILISHLSNQNSITASLFSLPMLRLLGEASFAFYLIHQPIIIILLKLKLSALNNQLIFSLTALLLATCASVIIYIYVEKPIEDKLKSKIKSYRLTSQPQPNIDM